MYLRYRTITNDTMKNLNFDSRHVYTPYVSIVCYERRTYIDASGWKI